MYPKVDPNPRFPEIERRILEFWERERIFEQSVENRPAVVDGVTNEFVFYDGPPFANGLPHYGHLVTGFVKDIIPRYQTMRGRRVERRFGWDCHGLPAELTAEKELGISGRQEILDYGIARFNAYCRVSVMRYTKEWQAYVKRQGRWVDFENDYKTMNLSFMDSVLWAFKQLWDKGLVYEGYRVVPYSWAVQSPLSNFEIRLDNSYRERQDPSLTVGFLLEPGASDRVPTRLLAWTTTPWTLPSNLALAVDANVDYAVLEHEGERAILAVAALERYAKELGAWAAVATIKGADLVGRRYRPLFPYFRNWPGAFVVLAGDFVDLDEGTGCVHIAPGFGEDDLELARAHSIDLVVPVDDAGRFTDDVPDYAGQNVFDANKAIIRDLKSRGAVVRHETIVHNYPHCWRSDEPVIYKAINAWYVRVSSFRDRMAELNKGITWIPEHVRDGLFGNWLENARDWNISRNRFWGCPIPVWKSDDPAYPRVDVYGSLDQIERDFGRRPDDLHRPMIDELVRPNPDDPTGRAMMRRVPEVLDVWFDSGSMPFAQLHYPFESKHRFDRNFPADFIVEYVAQTRGWFYTLMVLSTALFDRAPFRTCLCHGVVLDENKQKLSKRLRNYPDPIEVFEQYGADALRWYLVSSPLLAGGDLSMPRDGRSIAQALRQAMIPIWNAYHFFTLYANIDAHRARQRTDQKALLDRYILAKTRELVERLQDRLDAYDLPGAYAAVPRYINALNNWYIRRGRPRFWREAKDDDKRDAFDTLYTVLTIFCRAMAPLLPFTTEQIYKNLTDETSVHLADWPRVEALPDDRELVRRMDQVRDLCAAVMSLREAKNLRTRLPLKSLTIAHPDVAALEAYRDLITDEVNVKELRFTRDPASVGEQRLIVNPQIGRRLGSRMKDVMAAARDGIWSRRDGVVELAGITLGAEDFSVRMLPPAGLDSAPFDGGLGVILLDTQVYVDLEREGLARDFVRLVQQTRKDAGFDVTDRIRVAAHVADRMASDAIREHSDHICRETLAIDLRLNEHIAGSYQTRHKLSRSEVTIEVARI